jgi:hypothetical protein
VYARVSAHPCAAQRPPTCPAGLQASYAEDDSPQLSEDDDAGGAAHGGDGDDFPARAALGLRTKPRKVGAARARRGV